MEVCNPEISFMLWRNVYINFFFFFWISNEFNCSNAVDIRLSLPYHMNYDIYYVCNCRI